MSYNLLSNIPEALNYLQQAAGFTYLQSPATWDEAFKTAIQAAPKLVQAVSGEASAEITNIASAYASVGKDIYATAESGLKSAPVIESVFTQADQETAVVGEAALGTYVAGTSIAVPLATAVAGILSGLGIGILSYETAPEGWVDISNAIFGTNISYDEAQPLIRTYVQGMLSEKDGNLYTYFDDEYFVKAYAYFKYHVLGGIDFDFLENTVWEPVSGSTVPTNCTSATRQYLQHVSMPISSDELNAQYLSNLYTIWRKANEKVDIDDMPDLDVTMTDVINNLYSLYPNYHNANLFRVTFRFASTYGNINYFRVVIDGLRVADTIFNDVNISAERQLIYTSPELSSYNDSDFCYHFNKSGLSALFSYKYDFDTNTGVVKDDGSTYENYSFSTVYLNVYGEVSKRAGVNQNICMLWNIGSDTGVMPGLDDELTSKGFIIDPKYSSDVDPDTADNTKPNRKTNFQDQYAYWYGGKKQVAQPDANGEPKITTYIPTPIPMYVPDAATQVLTEGLGVVNNPNSIPVQVPAAMPEPYPNALPDSTPSTNVSDAIEKAVQSYNESRTTPQSAPDPLPDYETNPQYPDNPPKDPSGDSGTTPVPGDIPGVEASGLVSVYNPTKAQLVSFSGWLWSNNFLDNFLKIFQNPMDAIIGLHIIFATPTTGQTSNIIAGYLDSGVSSKVVTKQYGEINCGTVEVPEYFGNALDYEPYVQIHCYLPFIGIVSLKPNDILGKKLNITYGIDFLTGACLAMLTTSKGPQNGGSKIMTYTYAGNCAVQVPISGGSYAQMITGLAGVAVSAVAGVASANPIALMGAGASILNTHLDVQHSGSIGSNSGAMGPRKPFLIITRKSAYEAAGYNQFYGFPANKTIVLGSCRGFTRVKSIHIDSIPVATDTEKSEIEALLKQGVIIN